MYTLVNLSIKFGNPSHDRRLKAKVTFADTMAGTVTVMHILRRSFIKRAIYSNRIDCKFNKIIRKTTIGGQNIAHGHGRVMATNGQGNGTTRSGHGLNTEKLGKVCKFRIITLYLMELE